ncbi:MAG: hypothetical protein ABSH49_25430 [Bryobacteraceae bacterium]
MEKVAGYSVAHEPAELVEYLTRPCDCIDHGDGLRTPAVAFGEEVRQSLRGVAVVRRLFEKLPRRQAVVEILPCEVLLAKLEIRRGI